MTLFLSISSVLMIISFPYRLWVLAPRLVASPGPRTEAAGGIAEAFINVGSLPYGLG